MQKRYGLEVEPLCKLIVIRNSSVILMLLLVCKLIVIIVFHCLNIL